MQLRLDLDYDQTEYVQYKLNLVDRNLVSDIANQDYMLRRYQQLHWQDLPTVLPALSNTVRSDLTNLEAGCSYFEIQDFYTKYNTLHALPLPADDVLVVQADCAASSISRWNRYTVAINWYIQNWGSVYQYTEQNQIVDQFRPDDLTLWIVDLEQTYQVINLDNINQNRTYISWLYKDITINQLLANWTSHNK